MTKKRFTIDNFGFIFDDEELVDDVVELLNDLHEENTMLKQSSQDYEDNVSNWFIENWDNLSELEKMNAHLELGIELEDYDD